MQNDEIYSLSTLEWLETNKLGGYASGTFAGLRTRCEQGLLIASTAQGKFVSLSALDETIVMGSKQYELGSQQYPGVVNPEGYKFLKSFDKGLFPEFVFSMPGIEIKKTIAMLPNENTTLIIYEVIKASRKFEMELKPFCAARSPFELSIANEAIGHAYIFDNGLFRTLNYHGCPELFIEIPNSEFKEDRHWYRNFEYDVDRYHGQFYREDLFTHGSFIVPLQKGARLAITISLEEKPGRKALALFDEENNRRQQLVKGEWNNFRKTLLLASEQFIVNTRENNYFIVASYPRAQHHVRDELIALPGILLATKKTGIARLIITRLASQINGLIPSHDENNGLRYLSVDVSLWFIHIIYLYYLETSDQKFLEEYVPIIKEIIAVHEKGTHHNIKVDDSDGLLSGGEEGQSLTWMDARCEDWIVTPRRGKDVEINALWYNAISIVEYLVTELKENPIIWTEKVQHIKKSFCEVFWDSKTNSLYDYVDGDYYSQEFRPNQLFAISLPFSPIDEYRARIILEGVASKLATSRGLRTLAQGSKLYCPVYGGNEWHRKGALHQGTVWSYLLGAYCDGLHRVKGKYAVTEISNFITYFAEHIEEVCLGNISAIFDGDAPHYPRGESIAQAMAVGEMLRVMKQYNLFSKPEKMSANSNSA